MNLKNLLYTSYWFSSPEIVSGTIFSAWVFVLTTLIGVGVVLLLVRSGTTEKLLRSLLQRWSAFLFTIGLVGLLLFIFRQQSAFVLNWRVWNFILVASCFPWFIRLTYYSLKRYPQIKTENAARELKNKYLPEGN
jgi:hypothetical protein